MSEPLLVVIDMQELFRDPASPWLAPGFDELAEPITRLVDAFGERVAFTRFVLPETIEGSWQPYYATFPAVTDPANRGWFDLAVPYEGRASQTVDRSVFDAWGDRLRGLADQPPTLVLCGVATDCCVISTALPAADDGAYVRVVEDACRGSSAASHDAAVAVLRGYAPQIEITTVERELDAGPVITP
jgi:nicotinamidase-related amidase